MTEAPIGLINQSKAVKINSSAGNFLACQSFHYLLYYTADNQA